MTTTLQQLSPSQDNQELRVNEIVESLSAAGIFSRRHAAATGLTWAYYGGLYNGNTIADGTVTLTNTSDNYVVVLRSTGVVSTSTSSANSLNTAYAKLYKVTCAGGVVTAVVDQRWDANGLMTVSGGALTQCIAIACSDETTALTTGTVKVTFRMPYAFTLSDIRASVTTAPTGASLLTVDVNEAGATILSTKLTFDAGEKTTTTAATPRVISDAALADDAEITVDIDQIGSTIAGAGLKIYLIGTRP